MSPIKRLATYILSGGLALSVSAFAPAALAQEYSAGSGGSMPGEPSAGTMPVAKRLGGPGSRAAGANQTASNGNSGGTNSSSSPGNGSPSSARNSANRTSAHVGMGSSRNSDTNTAR
jgi:hypothetical protein